MPAVTKIDTEAVAGCIRRSVESILGDYVDLPIRECVIHEESQPARTEGIHVFLGVTGDLEGSVTLTIDDDFALKYTARMLDMEMTEYDEVVASAIGELGNMVVAQTTMNFQELGHNCDLTPPTIMRSESAELRSHQSSLLLLSFATDWGPLSTRVSLRPRSERPASTP
jgi:chemotaxis protein CheX